MRGVKMEEVENHSFNLTDYRYKKDRRNRYGIKKKEVKKYHLENVNDRARASAIS